MKTLDLYLQINEIKDTKNILEAGEYIKDNMHKSLFVFTQKGIILEYFKRYLHNEIESQEFVNIGDVSSKHSLVYRGLNHEMFFKVYNEIKNLGKKYKNSILIFDSKAMQYFKVNFENEFQYTIKELEDNNSKAFFI